MLRLVLAENARLDSVGDHLVLLQREIRTPIGPANLSLPDLTVGVPLNAITAGADINRTAQLHLVLGRIAAWGALEANLSGHTILRRAPPALVWSAPPRAPVRLSRFAFLRRHGERFRLEGEHAGPAVESVDASMFSLVHALRTPQTAETLSMIPMAAEWLRMLDGIGALSADALEADARRSWEFHDWLMHTRSRGGVVRRPLGGTWRFQGTALPEPPALRPPWPGPQIELPRLRIPDTEPSFQAVVERRRSTRTFAAAPLRLEALGGLLDRTARLRREDGKIRRVYPSGGGRYPLEMYLLVHRCEGVAPGVYHYDVAAHALTLIRPPSRRLAQSTWRGDAPVVLIIAARTARMAQKYQGIAYSLILKEVGGLIQSLYLAAAATRLAVCAIGSGNSAHFAEATGLDPFEEAPVGELIVGRPGA